MVLPSSSLARSLQSVNLCFRHSISGRYREGRFSSSRKCPLLRFSLLMDRKRGSFRYILYCLSMPRVLLGGCHR